MKNKINKAVNNKITFQCETKWSYFLINFYIIFFLNMGFNILLSLILTFDGQELWENRKKILQMKYLCDRGTGFLFLLNLNIFLLFFSFFHTTMSRVHQTSYVIYSRLPSSHPLFIISFMRNIFLPVTSWRILLPSYSVLSIHQSETYLGSIYSLHSS